METAFIGLVTFFGAAVVSAGPPLYEEQSGRRVDPELLKYWTIFCNVKMAVICLTALQRWVTSGGSARTIFAYMGLILPRLHQEIVELLEF